MFIEVSAKTGQGIDALLDSMLLQAEVLELKAANRWSLPRVLLLNHVLIRDVAL